MTAPPSRSAAAASGELLDHAAVALPPPLIYLLGWLAGWLLERRWPMAWNPSLASQVLGVAVGVAGGCLGAASLLTLRAAHTSPNPFKPTQVISMRGPYAFSRNPIYLGLALLYAGIAVFTRMGWGFVLLPVVLVAVRRLVIVREEAYLERKFGQAYRDYLGRVRRWV